ncbi:MAG TPA: HAD-IIA family hydrolase [Chloroflexota bacterium]
MREVRAVIMDMDGVVIHGDRLIDGAQEMIRRLQDRGIKFLILTNNSTYTTRDLAARLAFLGLEVPADALYTSALATARFLHTQNATGSAYVVAEAGVTTALHEIGYTLTEHDPDYVVIGETTSYSFGRIAKAVQLVAAGTRLIATNPDPVGPGTGGIVPATGALAALIARASGVDPYFIGKPNPLMLRTALRSLDVHSEEAIMVGDRMDTDIIMGVESGMETVLVLTGVTRREDVDRYPYQPSRILNSIADLEV